MSFILYRNKLYIGNNNLSNRIPLVDSRSYTPLLLAAVEGNSEAVETLLKNGADLFVQDKDDRSVLYWAAAQNHQNVLKVHQISRYLFYALSYLRLKMFYNYASLLLMSFAGIIERSSNI